MAASSNQDYTPILDEYVGVIDHALRTRTSFPDHINTLTANPDFVRALEVRFNLPITGRIFDMRTNYPYFFQTTDWKKYHVNEDKVLLREGKLPNAGGEHNMFWVTARRKTQIAKTILKSDNVDHVLAVGYLLAGAVVADDAVMMAKLELLAEDMTVDERDIVFELAEGGAVVRGDLTLANYYARQAKFHVMELGRDFSEDIRSVLEYWTPTRKTVEYLINNARHRYHIDLDDLVHIVMRRGDEGAIRAILKVINIKSMTNILLSETAYHVLQEKYNISHPFPKRYGCEEQMMEAVRYRHMEALTLLIKAGCDAWNDGLYAAVSYGYGDYVVFFLRRGADIDDDILQLADQTNSHIATLLRLEMEKRKPKPRLYDNVVD